MPDDELIQLGRRENQGGVVRARDRESLLELGPDMRVDVRLLGAELDLGALLILRPAPE